MSFLDFAFSSSGSLDSTLPHAVIHRHSIHVSCDFFTFIYFTCASLCICVWVCLCGWLSRTTCVGWFFPSTTWVSEMKLRLSDWWQSPLTAGPSHHPNYNFFIPKFIACVIYSKMCLQFYFLSHCNMGIYM